MFVTIIGFIVLSEVNSLKCVSMSNQEYKARPAIMNINNNETLFYPYSVLVNKFSGSCSNINDPYANLCAPNSAKNINIKVFTLILRTKETRHIKCHKICECKRRLDPSVCNNKHRWNNDKC